MKSNNFTIANRIEFHNFYSSLVVFFYYKKKYLRLISSYEQITSFLALSSQNVFHPQILTQAIHNNANYKLNKFYHCFQFFVEIFFIEIFSLIYCDFH